MLSSWRMGVKDLPSKSKLRFNVGGIEAETREGLVTEILKFMETEEGKKKSALWFGWGGTITLGLGEFTSLMIIITRGLMIHEYPWYFRILVLSLVLSGARYPRILSGEGQRKTEHHINVFQRVCV